ncbi:MAG: BTAD domain-containing putative transcriptional regulator, partial [Dongiaceae bacterium]
MPAERLLFRLAGPFAVLDGQGRALTPNSTKAQCALAYLALQPRHSATRPTLMGLLWSDRALPQAQASLRMCLFEIRTALKERAGLLRGARGEVALDPEALAVDIPELMERARRGEPEPEPPWSGALLSNLDGADPQFDEWLFLERARLRDDYCGALEARSWQAAERLDWRQAAILAGGLLKLDPTRESAHRLLITGFAEQGDIGAALRQYELLRELLARLLDARPSEATEALIRQLKSGRYVRRRAAAEAAADLAPAMAEAAGIALPAGGGRGAVPRPGSYPQLAIDNTAGPAAGPERPEPARNRVAIAVLPFETLGGDPQQQLFSDGICEDIIADLSRFREIFVIGRHTAFHYRGRPLQSRRIGAELGVQYLVQGTVRHAGDRVRVSVQLVRSEDGSAVWTERFDRPLADIFAVQDEVTRMIVASIAVRIEDAELATPLRQRPEQVKAYDLWLRGKRCLNGWT